YRITPLGGFGPLYFFSAANHGSGAAELVQAAGGNLYGANYNRPGNTGTGFRNSLAGNLQKILKLTRSTAGTVPNALLPPSAGNLWGTTAASAVAGIGRIYSTTTDGTFLQSIPMTQAAPGIQPLAPLIQATDGKLSGTASNYGPLPGGGFASGTIFVVDAGLGPSLTSMAVTAPNPPIPTRPTHHLPHTRPTP